MNQKRSIVLPFLALFFFSVQLVAQEEATDENAWRKKERQGEKAIDDSNWEEAKAVYSELLKEEPGNSEYNFYMALAYFQSEKDREKSISYFDKVNLTSVPQRDYFYGQALHYDGQFESAIEKFKSLLPLALDNAKGAEFKKEIENFIARSQNGIKHRASANGMLQVANLGNAVNTEKREYAPVVFEDRANLIFAATSTDEASLQAVENQSEANEDIFISSYIMMDDEWSKRKGPDGTLLNAGVNSSFNESPISFDANTDEFVIYRQADLFTSSKKEAPIAQNVDIVDLDADDITAIYQNGEGNYRFLVTDIFPGKGGLDIFYSVKTAETWSEWLNMENINTPYNEDSPYLAPDGTFYFSSQGHDAMGGHDIFKATKSGQNWSNPTNMGMPINSPANDIHFSVTGKNADVFYLASDRKGTTGSFDIYRISTCYDINNTTLNGKLLAEGNPLKDGTIYLKKADSTLVKTVKTDANGAFTFTVDNGESYIAEVAASNYLNQAFAFSIPSQCTEYPIYQVLSLDIRKNGEGVAVAQRGSMENAFYEVDRYKGNQTPEAFLASLPDDHRLKSKQTVEETPIESPILLAAEQFKDVRFGFDSDELAGTADAILSNVANYLQKNEGVTLVLTGHTDTKGASYYNKILSKKRAKAVAKMLQEKGVSKVRIAVEFAGEEKPLVADYDANGNYLEQEAEKNRRVEIEVVLPESSLEEEKK